MKTEEQKRRQREATARYTAAHPDRVAASRAKSDVKDPPRNRTARYRAKDPITAIEKKYKGKS